MALYTDWQENVNPHYILVSLKDGRKLKIQRANLPGGKHTYDAILQAFMDDNYEIVDLILAGILRRLEKK